MDSKTKRTLLLPVLALVLGTALLFFLTILRNGSDERTADQPSTPSDRTTEPKPHPELQGSEHGRVSIQVSHIRGLEPLPDVVLQFDGDGLPAELGDCRSDKKGTFSLELTPGDYRVRSYWHNLMESDWKTFRIQAGSVSKVQITYDTYPFLTVSGTVKAKGGRPVANAMVVLTYDRDKDAPPEVGETLGDGSADTITDAQGRFRMQLFIYPWKYELYAKSGTHESLRDPPVTIDIPETQAKVYIKRDLPVESLFFTDVTGRVVGPDGVPLANTVIITRKALLDEEGKPKGYLETTRKTDSNGRFRFRTTYDHITILVRHPLYSASALRVNVDVAGNANKVQQLEDIHATAKATPLKARLVLEESGSVIQGELIVREFEGGTGDIVSFGNTSHRVKSTSGGVVELVVDPTKRYHLGLEGYDVSKITGDVGTTRVKGVVNFAPEGGVITVYLRKR